MESTILYINGEHCSSIEQLKNYFKENLTPESGTYADLLDYGRAGDITKWLDENDAPDFAEKVRAVDNKLSDSAFIYELSKAITGQMLNGSESIFKPPFEKCLQLKETKIEQADKETTIHIILQVLLSVNEEYELAAICEWGTRAIRVNPYCYSEGELANVCLRFRKRPGKEIGEIKLRADGKELSVKNVRSNDNNVIFSVDGVEFKMIHVEGGTFMMGATPEMKNTNDNEKPVHEVTLSSYYIGETPVTQELWKAVMGDKHNPSEFKDDQHPVEMISYRDCLDFIERLNQKIEKKFRLPTESEWEFAGRGGNKSHHTQYSGGDNLAEVAWYRRNSGDKTHPVKQKKPNELSIYDMSGNVEEWCQDKYDCYSKSKTAQTNPIIHPRLVDTISGFYGVHRGGCHVDKACSCRLSSRIIVSSNCRSRCLGFRLALSMFKTDE